jgi:transcriptional regulator with XRE-family HTH domain
MNNVRALREAKGWSVREVGVRAGIPWQTINNYERGVEPTLNNARLVAMAFRRSLDYVFPPPVKAVKAERARVKS